LHKILFCLLSISSILAAQENNFPKREFRAVWVATVANLDWPKNRDTIPDVQRAELDTLMLRLKNIGFNAVLFQVRPECDALYRSELEPWSYWLTGAQGNAPNPEWDPLQYAVELAHRLGMELHAWFNPFRAERTAGMYPLASSHVINKHPEWILTFNNNLRMLDPGNPEVRKYVAEIVSDVVRRYDVDGIHWDDYFYPYPPNNITAQDDSSYAAFNSRKLNKSDWRRENINVLVKMVADSIKAIKPWVKFGISPFGVWKNERPNGTSAYDNLYNDAVYWMQQRYLDYLSPQLYWQMGSANDYSKLLLWWNSQVNGRHLYPGHAAYRMNESNWEASEILNQLRLDRKILANSGAVFFRATLGILNNPKGFADSLKNNFFHYPALVPSMPWIDSIPPLSPLNLTAAVNANAIILQWQKPSTTLDGDSAKRFVIYKAETPDTININEVKQILAITTYSETDFSDTAVVDGGTYSYAVTSLDKLNNESDASARISVTFLRAKERIAELEGFLFLQNYNEDIDTTETVHFTLSTPSQVSIKIYDIFEREVSTIVEGVLDADEYSYRLYMGNLPSGIYFIRTAAGSTVKIKRIVVRK